MTDEEIVSLIRNWTVGELSTVSATVGVFVNSGTQPRRADRLRASLTDGNALEDSSEIALAVEEIMRLEDTLVTNRRVTTRDTELGSPHRLPAPRDHQLGPPQAATRTRLRRRPHHSPHRDQSRNLVYGDGIPSARRTLARAWVAHPARGATARHQVDEIADEREANRRMRYARSPATRLCAPSSTRCYRHRRCRSRVE